jgi:hypothetical protein
LGEDGGPAGASQTRRNFARGTLSLQSGMGGYKTRLLNQPAQNLGKSQREWADDPIKCTLLRH